MELISPNATKLSRALGIPIWQLLGVVSNLATASLGSRRVPLLHVDKAGKLAPVSPAEEFGMNYLLVSADSGYSADVFAQIIQGDSMMPEYREGDCVVIDPNVMAEPGDCVVAVDQEGRALFRKFRDVGANEDGNRVFELLPLNKMYPSVRSDRQFLTIKGVMVEHRIYRRR